MPILCLLRVRGRHDGTLFFERNLRNEDKRNRCLKSHPLRTFLLLETITYFVAREVKTFCCFNQFHRTYSICFFNRCVLSLSNPPPAAAAPAESKPVSAADVQAELNAGYDHGTGEVVDLLCLSSRVIASFSVIVQACLTFLAAVL